MYRVPTKRRNPASDPKTIAQVQAEQAFIAEHERLHSEYLAQHLAGPGFGRDEPLYDGPLDPATHMSDEDWDELEEVMSRHAGERRHS